MNASPPRDRERNGLQEAFDDEVAVSDSLRNENARLQANVEGERRAAHERAESFKQAAEALAEKFKGVLA
jgi:hypothetical protein